MAGYTVLYCHELFGWLVDCEGVSELVATDRCDVMRADPWCPSDSHIVMVPDWAAVFELSAP